jgi:hypothetical protein
MISNYPNYFILYRFYGFITIGRNPDWPKTSIGRGHERAARFRPISSIFLQYSNFTFSIFYFNTVLYTLELWQMKKIALDCHDWFKNYKEQHSTKNNSASSSL